MCGTHADVGIGVIEPVTHEELLDTFLIDCDNVRNIGIAGGMVFCPDAGEYAKSMVLWSEGEVAKYAGLRGTADAGLYLWCANDAYTIEETGCHDCRWSDVSESGLYALQVKGCLRICRSCMVGR